MPDKGIRIVGFERVPAIEIGERGRLGNLTFKRRENFGLDLKPEKRQVMGGEKSLDPRQRKSVFHDIESRSRQPLAP